MMAARHSLNISSVGWKVGLMHCQITGAQHEAYRPAARPQEEIPSLARRDGLRHLECRYGRMPTLKIAML